MGLIVWERPKKIRSTKDHNTQHSSDCGVPLDFSYIKGIIFKYFDGENYYIDTVYEYACENCRSKLSEFAKENYFLENFIFDGVAGMFVYYIQNFSYGKTPKYDVKKILDRIYLN